MRKRALVLAVIIAMIAAACGDSDLDSATSTSAVTPEVTTTAIDIAVETTPTTVPAATTAAPATSTTAAVVTPTTTAPSVPAGMPPTWFGAYNDFDAGFSYAVEVDSATGTIVRVIDSYTIDGCVDEGPDGECVIYEEGVAPVSVDVANSLVAFGLCCEPVSGFTQVFRRSDGSLFHSVFGSEPRFGDSTVDGALATFSYFDGGLFLLHDLNDGGSVNNALPIAADWGDSMDWDGTRMAFQHGRNIALWIWNGSVEDEGAVTPSVAPDTESLKWESPTFQASGNLVVAQNVDGSDSDSLGVVLDTSGGFTLAVDTLVLATFPYGGRVVNQTYDESGTFLIYTLTDGSVRWLGRGSSGILAEPDSGYTAAGWHD